MSMRYRPLGRTGIEVSAYCLGAMMFGSVGNKDHDDCAPITHSALDLGGIPDGRRAASEAGRGAGGGELMPLAPGRVERKSTGVDVTGDGHGVRVREAVRW